MTTWLVTSSLIRLKSGYQVTDTMDDDDLADFLADLLAAGDSLPGGAEALIRKAPYPDPGEDEEAEERALGRRSTFRLVRGGKSLI